MVCVCVCWKRINSLLTLSNTLNVKILLATISWYQLVKMMMPEQHIWAIAVWPAVFPKKRTVQIVSCYRFYSFRPFCRLTIVMQCVINTIDTDKIG